MTEEKKKTGLELLREPFPENLISKLPKPTAQKEVMDKLPKAKCSECGGYHATSKIIHLDYVGHAALTDRLLDCDPEYSWEPFALDDHGLPLFDKSGGLWIKLTVCGVTRPGYGHAKQNKYAEIGSREKEVIGDGLRNAAMRFGAALDLWHKGDLHVEDDDGDQGDKKDPVNKPEVLTPFEIKQVAGWISKISSEIKNGADKKSCWESHKEDVMSDCGEEGAKKVHSSVFK